MIIGREVSRDLNKADVTQSLQKSVIIQYYVILQSSVIGNLNCE